MESECETTHIPPICHEKTLKHTSPLVKSITNRLKLKKVGLSILIHQGNTSQPLTDPYTHFVIRIHQGNSLQPLTDISLLESTKEIPCNRSVALFIRISDPHNFLNKKILFYILYFIRNKFIRKLGLGTFKKFEG